MYISLDLENELNCSSSLRKVEHFIADIRLFMAQILLRLNDNKTNIIYLLNPQRWMHLSLGKHLRVIFDKCINMYEHVTSVCGGA